MTATRIGRCATIAVAAGTWLGLVWLLWRTTVPSVHPPRLDERSIFGAALVERARRHERLLDWEWVAATALSLGAYVVMIQRSGRLARRLGLRPANCAIVLGLLTWTVVWGTTLPFVVVENWWERRHGISREGYAAAISQHWVQLLATSLYAFIALGLILALAQRFGRRWWIAAAPAVVVLVLALQLVIPFVTSLGTHPLRSAKLRSAAATLERREHAGRPPIRVQDVSGKTTAANAFAIGIGPTERLVIWNTMLDGRFPIDQVRFVIGHELGHLARDHILRGVGWFALFVVPLLAVLAHAVDVRQPAAIPVLLLVVALAQLALQPVRNVISRRIETEADWIALNGTRDPAADRGLFKGFVATSLQDPSPPRWVHVLLDDHPTALQRVELARAWELRNR
jgi:STE24 endopeptidase